MLVNRASADILLFNVADRRGAILLDCVEEVLRAVAITPLARAPHLVEGVINVRGDVVPVLNLRARFGLPRRKLSPSDRFILVRTGSRRMALRADSAGTIASIATVDIESAVAAVTADDVVGVARLNDELALIHDIGRFLSAAEQEDLERALAGGDAER